MASKSETDLHWNARALAEGDATRVNIADTAQRVLEDDFIFPNLPAGRLLEVGCGNGFLTHRLREKASHVDAFDYSENMIARARELYGETNNRFFHDNLLDAKHVAPPYDGIVCVRVLINLRDTQEQRLSVRNMASWLRPDGKLILVEGYRDGFDQLNELRRACGIEPLAPAAINHYSRLDELMETIRRLFRVERSFHSGMFDFLTRVVYPVLAGADKATGHSEFHERILPIARRFNPEQFEDYARLRGYLLARL